MKTYGLPLFSLVILAFLITLACGTPQRMILPNCSSLAGSNTTGTLQSISVCPATADAGQYNGQVQYTAIGTYDTQPSPVTLKPQVWGACLENTPTTDVTITTTGLAQCTSGASGTYTVFASDMTNCLVIGPCGEGCFVTGTAHLTCP